VAAAIEAANIINSIPMKTGEKRNFVIFIVLNKSSYWVPDAGYRVVWINQQATNNQQLATRNIANIINLFN
jgi:hypothetical protein